MIVAMWKMTQGVVCTGCEVWVTWLHGVHEVWVTWGVVYGVHEVWVTWGVVYGVHEVWVSPDQVYLLPVMSFL